MNLIDAFIYLGENSVYFDETTNERIIFRMPTVGENNETLPMIIYNPAGRHSGMSITRLPGVEVAPLPTTMRGYSNIRVLSNQAGDIQDSFVSLDEAVMIANGQLNIVERDDLNQKNIEVRREIKDEEGNVSWLVVDQYDTEPSQLRNGTDRHETREYWRRDNRLDGTVDEYLTKTEDLDVAPYGEPEEAEYVSIVTYEVADITNSVFKNEISIEANGTIFSNGFSLTEQDRITLASGQKLVVNGGITLKDGCVFDVSEVELSAPLRLQGNSIHIDSCTISGSETDGVVIEHGCGQTVEPAVIHLE